MLTGHYFVIRRRQFVILSVKNSSHSVHSKIFSCMRPLFFCLCNMYVCLLMKVWCNKAGLGFDSLDVCLHTYILVKIFLVWTMCVSVCVRVCVHAWWIGGGLCGMLIYLITFMQYLRLKKWSSIHLNDLLADVHVWLFFCVGYKLSLALHYANHNWKSCVSISKAEAAVLDPSIGWMRLFFF